MAYLLSFDDSNDYVDIPPLPVMSNFDIIMDFSNTGNVQTIIGSNTPSDVESNNSHFRIGVSSTGKVLVLNGTETIESSSSVNGGDIRTVTYSVRNHTGGFSGTAELFLEGAKEGATTSFRGACLANSTITFLGRSVSSDQGARNFTGGSLRRLRVIDYDTPSNSRDYLKQSLIGGNDTTYDEQDNGLDGTLQNFPTDNSQWVFYDAGGGPTYSMLLESGDYTLIGGSLSLLANRAMQLDAGAYSLADGSATLAANRVMQLNQGSYLYTGGGTYLLASRSISLQSGNYTYTGGSATLAYNQTGGATYVLPLEGGDYTVNAGSAGLLVNRTIQIYGGAYAISGGSSRLLFNRKMQLDGAAYLYTPVGVTILARHRMTLEGSSYNYDGGSVTLSYSGEVIALISGYTVQYKSDDVNASYIDDYIKARFQ